MLGIPERTAYDLQFRVFGFPVRIHPLFWLGSLILGWQVGEWPERFLWIGCVLVSVLVHELGHAVAARANGQRPSIDMAWQVTSQTESGLIPRTSRLHLPLSSTFWSAASCLASCGHGST